MLSRDPLPVATERISCDRLRKQGAEPAAVAAHPGGRIRRVQRYRLAVDGQLLVDLLRNNGDVVSQ